MRKILMLAIALGLAACSHDRPPPQTPATTSATIEREAPELQSTATVAPGSAGELYPSEVHLRGGSSTPAPGVSPLEPQRTWGRQGTTTTTTVTPPPPAIPDDSAR